MTHTKESILSEIGDLLTELNVAYVAVAANIPGDKSVELLLLEAKADYLAAYARALRTLYAQPDRHFRTVSEEIVPAEDKEAVFSPPAMPVNEPTGEAEQEEIQPEPLEMDTERGKAADPDDLAVPEESETGPEELPEEQPVMPESPKPIGQQTVAKETPARPLTLNEKLKQRQKAASGGSGAMPSEKTIDLKTAINLNDKLLFTKDLFNGYSLAYTEAIDMLNRYPTFAEADAFLQTNYALKNNWAEKPQTVEKLYAVLRKKFL